MTTARFTARFTAAWLPLSGALFRRHFAARVLSWTGTAVSPIALAFAVLGIGGGVGGLGVVLAADMAARAALLLVGGAVADRWPRSTVLVAANVVAAVGQGCAAALVWSGTAQEIRITCKTLLELPDPPPSEPSAAKLPDHPAYQQIMAVFAVVNAPLRARAGV
ncbi:hypothetical protein ACFV3E_27475 [Streptomyces sp. NPDC059718]